MGIELEATRMLVVGASAGVGRAVARQAIGAGADVVVAARRPKLLESLVEEAGGGQGVAADLCGASDNDRRGGGAGGRLGALDVVLFCAGGAGRRPVRGQAAGGLGPPV